MVNSEDFSKRLKVIFDYYNLSASSFADQIDVGRASISHILSGRNKPSLDFVMKVVSTFKEVELYWLLNGKGQFPPNTSQKEIGAPKEPLKEVKKIDKELPNNTLFNTVEQNNSSTSKKTIEKVIIFYSDGSFEPYENLH